MPAPRPRTPLEKFPEPELGNEAIPAERYTSEAFAREEWDRMWTRVWLCAAPLSDLEQVGSYTTFEIGRESVILTRPAAGELRAFLNSCQHRGSQVVTRPGCGRSASLVCPYHLWTYDLRGELVRVPDREDFRGGIPQRARLQELRCDSWGGWLWINFDAEAKPLADYLGAVAPHLDAYHFDEHYALAEDISFEWDCNWKVGVDAFNEVYHVQGIHPELLPFTDDVDCPIDLFGRHSRFLFHVLRRSPRWTDSRARARGYRDAREWCPEVKQILAQLQLEDRFDGDMDALRLAATRRMRELGAAAGLDFSDLQDEQLWLDVHYTIFPNLTLNISPGHFWFFRHRPHPDDPNRMFWDFQEYRRVPAGAPRPPRPEALRARWGDGHEQRLHLALRQDGDACPAVQRGMRSRGFAGPTLAHQERRIRHFHRVLSDYLEGRD